MVDKALRCSVEALQGLDDEAARLVIQDTQDIDQQRRLFEGRAVALLARQVLSAPDLRRLVAMLHIADDLARIGDHAAGIAGIVLRHWSARQLLLRPLPLAHLPWMAEHVRDTLRRGLEAFVTMDADESERIAADAAEVGAVYNGVYLELLGSMLDDSRTLDRATWLLWAAQHLERSADLVAAICERVVNEAASATAELNGSPLPSPGNPIASY
jgi:phosphate transport system protein